jgi:plastocyanin
MYWMTPPYQALATGSTDLRPALTSHLPWAVGTSQPTHTFASISYQSHANWSTATPIHSSVAHPTATVIVGNEGKLVFSPSSLNASVGTTIAFNFLGLNHTLTQSRLHDPCLSHGGFDSGFNQFNPSNISGRFIVEYEVTSENPEWFFCAQVAPRPHCQAGMVFSLNPHGLHPQFVSNAMATIPSTTSQNNACGLPTLSIVQSISGATPSGAPSTANTTVALPTFPVATATLPVVSSLGTSVTASDMLMWFLVIVVSMI